ncbi:hypothetical protein VTJ49DRAFT_2586 [Mycothermus thermophilus]|uniref:Uncharacterized protein n=1 Tax=Humicola insolens TaxID=85995 RepID=A0ABR3VMW0_HUMIN
MGRVMNEYSNEVDLNRAVDDPFYALSPLFRIAISSEMDLLQLIETTVNRELDHSSSSFGAVPTASPTLSNLLYSQQILKRHMRYLQATISFLTGNVPPLGNRHLEGGYNAPHQPHSHCGSITRTKRTRTKNPAARMAGKGTAQAEYRGNKYSSTFAAASRYADESTKTVDAVLADCRYALQYAEGLSADCVQGMSIIAHHASILESRKAIAEARDVTRLTRLATVFVPLTLVTSVFGMNVREVGEENGPPLWVWAVSSVVVGIVSWAVVLHDRHTLARMYEEFVKSMDRGVKLLNVLPFYAVDRMTTRDSMRV